MSRPDRSNPRKGLGTNCAVRTVGMVLRNIGPLRSRRLRFHVTCSSDKIWQQLLTSRPPIRT